MDEKRKQQLREAGRKGGLIGGQARRRRALERYYADPAICNFCGSIIEVKDNEKPSEAKRKRFCNHSCAASYINIERGNKPARVRACLYCGNSTRNNKYCSMECSAAHQREKILTKIEKAGKAESQKQARTYLLARRLHKCEICGITEWCGMPVPLVVDHINGNGYDHRLENLRLTCHNCGAQLPTFANRNNGNGRWERRKRYARRKEQINDPIPC